MMSLSANLKQKQLLCGFIPSKSFLQVSLCHIVYHYPRALPLLCPPGRGVVIILLPRIKRIGRMSVLWRGWEQDKNQINPLERMEGIALTAMLPL